MVLNLAAYSFFDLQEPFAAKKRIEDILVGTGTVGTLLLAPEGVNFNLAGTVNNLEEIVSAWLKSFGASDFSFKRSFSTSKPFKRLRAKVKKEIITMGVRDLRVQEWRAPRMSPADFAKIVQNQPEEVLLLDTRNDFEVGVGTFNGATPAGMKSFTEFPRVAERLPRDKSIVMFCTGGIRCEKASAYLRKLGFENVFQLEGGILNYFEHQGRVGFEGSCFVFDERASLDAITPAGEASSQDSLQDKLSEKLSEKLTAENPL